MLQGWFGSLCMCANETTSSHTFPEAASRRCSDVCDSVRDQRMSVLQITSACLQHPGDERTHASPITWIHKFATHAIQLPPVRCPEKSPHLSQTLGLDCTIRIESGQTMSPMNQATTVAWLCPHTPDLCMPSCWCLAGDCDPTRSHPTRL